jgi:hypothetical protein
VISGCTKTRNLDLKRGEHLEIVFDESVLTTKDFKEKEKEAEKARPAMPEV